MELKLGITIGDRIKQAEKLPNRGSIEYMAKVKSLKNILVGFADAQMINWRIIKYNGTFITALPDTTTSITLNDDMIKIFAEIIKERSMCNDIDIDEADMYQKVLDAYNSIIETEMAEAQKAMEESMNQQPETNESDTIEGE